jgi:hypothetical protein
MKTLGQMRPVAGAHVPTLDQAAVFPQLRCGGLTCVE